MSAFDPVDLRVVQATQPYFVYHRYALTTPRVYSLFDVPYGFNYLVRSVVTRWDMWGAVSTSDPPLSAEVFNAAASRARQTVPVPFSLFSTPGGETFTAVEAGAPFGISFASNPLTSARIVNLAFPYGDTLRVEITGQIPGYTFLDIVLRGYLIPESVLAIWGNRPISRSRNVRGGVPCR